MPLVLQRCPSASFLFAGQNPARAQHLLDIAAEGGVSDRLALLGRVDEEEKVRLMRSSDCLVYPTRYESFGLPPLEAMASGCPVVASDIPVVNEMITDGENGVLVAPESPAALADGILRVLTDAGLRERLVAGGRHTLARYSEAELIGQVETLYQEVTA
jgi:glycosyltransferase involved in cell wall biosynthesis